MKKLFLIVLLIGINLLHAQTKPAQPVKTVNPPVILKTQMDTISYILGESAGYNLVQQGFGDIKLNMSVYNRGLTDITGKKKPLLDDNTANAAINSFYMKMQEQKSKASIETGRRFLAANKQRPTVKTTASGLQYEILQEGTGEKMTPLDTFVCHYRGTLIDGKEFDASYNRGTPLKMALTDVIQGWKEGLVLMPVGTKFKLYIPYELGYGIMGQGQIPGGAVLIFDMELIGFVRKQ